MDVHLHYPRTVPGGQLVLEANAGQHTDERLIRRFEELTSTFGPESTAPDLQQQLRTEFNWKGFTNIEVRLIPDTKESP